MKILKGLVFAGIVLFALFAIGRLFLAQLGTVDTASGPPGVILAAPPGVKIENLGEVTRTEAALRLSDLLGPSGENEDAGVHFLSGDGQEIYWYAERDENGESVLVERRSGPGSTRLETRWQGSISTRLDWARAHESFDAPQVPPGEQRNLYH